MAGKKNILVVEDEAHLAHGIRFNLEADGYRVATVGDGPSALEELARGTFDLVILDLMLPGMSGYTVCETMRERGIHTPVLILSARSLAEDRTRGFDAGADQYLIKPFDLDELLSRVKNLLARHGGALRPADKPLERFRFGNVEVNFETFEARVAGEPVRLTHLEMKLLQYFIRHAGRVIPRGELLEQVWDMPAHIHTRAPDQFILRLRKMFEPDSTRPRHFLTIRDAGYRFVAAPEAEAPEEPAE